MTIRIASYNLWNGASDTYFRLVDFAKAQKFDVLCLQEINGWENNDFARLKDFADHVGLANYEYCNSNSEYKLVTLTTLPITMRTVHVEGFWHCVVETHVKVGEMELVILNLHLDPWKEDPRLREVERLLKLIDTSKPTIIMGDTNSVSRADNYPPEFLAELQKRRIDKFGQGSLDFRVTDCLTAAGFVDAAAKLDRMDTTVPSPFSTDRDHEVPARLDYAYVSSSLVPMVRDLSVVKNEETDKISDHYPVALTLDTQPEQPKDVPTEQTADPELAPQAEKIGPEANPTEFEIKLH
jgi:exodeoxyribonuclease-3